MAAAFYVPDNDTGKKRGPSCVESLNDIGFQYADDLASPTGKKKKKETDDEFKPETIVYCVKEEDSNPKLKMLSADQLNVEYRGDAFWGTFTKLQIDSVLGEGSFGEVYLASCYVGGQERKAALKYVSLDKKPPKSFKDEAGLTKRFGDSNVGPAFYAAYTVMKKKPKKGKAKARKAIAGIILTEVLQEFESVYLERPDTEKWEMIHESIPGVLMKLAKLGYIYLDLKLENMMYTETMHEMRLIDFDPIFTVKYAVQKDVLSLNLVHDKAYLFITYCMLISLRMYESMYRCDAQSTLPADFLVDLAPFFKAQNLSDTDMGMFVELANTLISINHKKKFDRIKCVFGTAFHYYICFKKRDEWFEKEIPFVDALDDFAFNPNNSAERAGLMGDFVTDVKKFLPMKIQ